MHRHPFATDAYELGYAVGVREDYNYQIEDLANVDLPVNILDNDFRDPDVDRYLKQFEKYDPSVAILGDAYDQSEAERLNDVAGELLNSYPYKELVVVPKCREAINIIDESLVLGYSMGYSDITAEDFSDTRDWRGKRIHLLGASPPKQYLKIQDLTQPTLNNDPPADITGLDWNGVHSVAYKGEYWSQNGWQRADHLSIRETVHTSLKQIKRYWQSHGIWPSTTPRELYGPATLEPDEPVYTVNGADIHTQEQLEDSIITEYEIEGERMTWAFQSLAEQNFLEWRDGLISQ